MPRATAFYDTTIGKKAVMAVSGALLFGFVIGHMLGNLQVFLGPSALNGYAEKLHHLGPLLWFARAALLVALFAHLLPAYQLWSDTFAARSERYRIQQDSATSYAARTMIVSGPLVLLFLAYHLAHFTVPGIAMSAGYEHSVSDVYSNVVSGFSIPWVSAIYLAAQAALALHLHHGGASVLQTLGLDHPRFGVGPRRAAEALAIAIWLGNSAIPIAVLAGVVR